MQAEAIKAAPFIAAFSKGSVELVAVSDHPSADGKWWCPDGSEYTGKSLYTWDYRVDALQDKMTKKVVVRFSDIPDDVSKPIFKLDLNGSRGGSLAGYASDAVDDGVALKFIRQ
jgi:hypothetical protein